MSGGKDALGSLVLPIPSDWMPTLDDMLLYRFYRKCRIYAFLSHPPPNSTGADPRLVGQTGVCDVPGVEGIKIGLLQLKPETSHHKAKAAP